VLVPTRELALQVAEAFLKYAAHLKGFHVLPIYGGQSYSRSSTPYAPAVQRGRWNAWTRHRYMNRGTLKLAGLTLLVLDDEADEMLRMGLCRCRRSILEQTPPQRQVALFSATIPPRFAALHRNICARPSKSPSRARPAPRPTSVSGTGCQRMHKLDALTRILEAETFDGMLVFTRTKQATVELAEKLEARGFAAAPLNATFPSPSVSARLRGSKPVKSISW